MSNDKINGRDVALLYGVDSVATAAAAAQHVYVASTGSDANAGTTGAPKLTLAGAYALIPLVLTGPFVVHLASGSYVYTEPPAFVANANGFVAVIGDGAGQGAQDGFTLVSSGTVAAGSTNPIVKTTGLTASALIGLTLQITSGAASGCRRTISENTTTDITLGMPLTNTSLARIAATAGDTYRIVRPATTLTIAAGLSFGKQILVNVAIADAAAAIAQGSADAPPLWFGVELGAASLASVDHSLYIGCTDETPLVTARYGALRVALGQAAGLQWQGWGLSQPSATYAQAIAMNPRAVLCAYVGLYGGAINPNTGAEGSLITLRGGRLYSIMLAKGDLVINAETPLLLTPLGVGGVRAIELRGTVQAVVRSAVSILMASNNTSIVLFNASRLFCIGTPATIDINTQGTGQAVYCYDQSALQSDTTITVTAPNGGGFHADHTSALSVRQFTCTGLQVSRLIESATAAFRFLTITASGDEALRVEDAAQLHMGVRSTAGTLSLTATAPGTAALVLSESARLTVQSPVVTTISNASTAANSDGAKIIGNAVASFNGNPTIITSGSSGYGMNCRGGGRATFFVQPSGVVGPTADFSVGNIAGDDFADTALSASLSFRVSGASAIARTA